MTRTYLHATVEHFPILVGGHTHSLCIVKHVISRDRQNPRIQVHVVATLLPVEAHEDVCSGPTLLKREGIRAAQFFAIFLVGSVDCTS